MNIHLTHIDGWWIAELSLPDRPPGTLAGTGNTAGDALRNLARSVDITDLHRTEFAPGWPDEGGVVAETAPSTVPRFRSFAACTHRKVDGSDA